MNHVLFSTIFNIGVVLFISLILIRKNYIFHLEGDNQKHTIYSIIFNIIEKVVLI
jgi:hypothetical protein